MVSKALPTATLERLLLLGHVQLFATPWTIAHQALLSVGFSRQEYWSRLAFPSARDLPDPGIEPGSPGLGLIAPFCRFSGRGGARFKVTTIMEVGAHLASALGSLPHTTTWTHPHITEAQAEPEPFKSAGAGLREGMGPKPQARPELHSLGRVSGHLAFSL